jgi:hypothetical protein
MEVTGTVTTTAAELSIPPTGVTLLLTVAVPNLPGYLEEALRGLVMTVTHLDLVVLVVEETAAGDIPEGQQVTMKIVHGLLSSKRWPMLLSCHRRAAGKTSPFPRFPHLTPFWPGEIKSRLMSHENLVLATRVSLGFSRSATTCSTSTTFATPVALLILTLASPALSSESSPATSVAK